MTAVRMRRVGAIVCLLFAMPSSNQCMAGTGDIFENAGRRSGLTVTLSATWPEVNGARPCRITVRPLGQSKFARDRALTIRLFPYRRRDEPHRRHVVVTQELQCEEGAELATVTMMLRQEEWIAGCDLSVFESGQRLNDVSATYDFPTSNSNRYDYREGLPSILLVDSRADGQAISRNVPNWLLPFENSLRNLAKIQRNVANKNKFELQDLRRFDAKAPADLPTNWVGLGGIDLVLIRWDELHRMTQQSPQQWSAMSAWVRAGGNLVVFDMGLGISRAGELETLVGVAHGDEESDTWQLPPRKNRDEQVEAFKARNRREAIEVVRLGPSVKRTEASFMFRPFGAGLLIAAMGQETPFNTSKDWQGFFNTISADRWLTYRRLGAGVETANEDFWDFRIQGVGRAPINVFRILITLFALVIGPLNYFLLRRIRRTSWMLVTVPLGALVATSTLLGYAVITDGLGVRTRIRSLTHYDQRIGHVSSWSRQVYYASIVPSGGMSFPSDALVVPLQFPGQDDQPVQRSVFWDNHHQVMESGYLTSRTLSQFYVVRSRPSQSGLEVSETYGRPPTAVNRLGVNLRSVCIHDSTGKIYVAEDVAAGKPLELREVNAGAAQELLSLTQRLAVGPVAGFQAFYGSVDGHLPAPSQQTTSLELRLLAIRNSPTALGAKSFVAVADGCEEISPGVKQAREEDSVFVITGQW